MNIENKVNVFMSVLISFTFGLIWGGIVCLLDPGAGLITGSVLMFICFYGLLRRSWVPEEVEHNRRFSDHY